jgi:hypothetical protein
MTPVNSEGCPVLWLNVCNFVTMEGMQFAYSSNQTDTTTLPSSIAISTMRPMERSMDHFRAGQTPKIPTSAFQFPQRSKGTVVRLIRGAPRADTEIEHVDLVPTTTLSSKESTPGRTKMFLEIVVRNSIPGGLIASLEIRGIRHGHGVGIMAVAVAFGGTDRA